MSPLDAFALSMLSPIGAVVFGRWSERRQLAREAHLAACLRRDRVAADARVEHHWVTLPDFLKGTLQ